MKTIAIVLLLFVSLAYAEDVTTQTGEVYEDVEITRVEPDGISIKHSAGIQKLFFPQLPEEYQKKYGYNEEEAKAYYKRNRTIS